MDNSLQVKLEIPFDSERVARIAYDVLRVDAEPKRSGAKKEFVVDETILKVTFQASLAKQLRVAVNNFFDKIDLILEIMNELGPPKYATYNHY